jgi:signal recognition particle GTPase
MKMSNDKIDIDMALPMNLDAVNDYYRNNKIRKTSFSSSTETISSTNSQNFNEKTMELVNVEEEKRQNTLKDRTQQLIKNDVSASTTSNAVDDVSKYSQRPEIKAVNVCDSSDVHFGNKIYNGPITIKQKIVLKDEEGILNKGFEGTCKKLIS